MGGHDDAEQGHRATDGAHHRPGAGIDQVIGLLEARRFEGLAVVGVGARAVGQWQDLVGSWRRHVRDRRAPDGCQGRLLV